MELISIRQLSTALPWWSYNLIKTVSYYEAFKGLVEERPTKRSVLIENVPKFLEVLYQVLQR